MIDRVAVLRAVLSGTVRGRRLRQAESDYALAWLARHGYSDGQIAHALGYNRRSVLRARQRLGIPASLSVGANQYDLRIGAPTRHRSKQ